MAALAAHGFWFPASRFRCAERSVIFVAETNITDRVCMYVNIHTMLRIHWRLINGLIEAHAVMNEYKQT